MALESKNIAAIKRGLMRSYGLSRLTYKAGLAGLSLMLLFSATPGSAATETCGGTLPGWRKMSLANMIFIDDHGARFTITVRIADEHDERAAGYQYICPEEMADTGILFVFREPLSGKFHMRNVYGSLDIAFFDEKGMMVDRAIMRPEPPGFKGKRRYYGSRLPYRFALETPQGYLAGRSFSPGKARLVLGSLP